MDDEIVSLRRLRLEDGVPIVIEAAALRAECRPVLGYDLATESLHQALRIEGIILARGRATILADRAGAEEAGLLEIVEGDPLLVERVLIYDNSGTPVECTESRYAAERYQLDVDFVVESER